MKIQILHKQSLPQRAIAKQLDISRNTVRKENSQKSWTSQITLTNLCTGSPV
ncbi:hypothetical protein [Shewanella oneidensis]|uniref:hypothetical protein n=1 Tax=Shewanella oneidensis TaxID=70863 RepID=UPI00386BAEAE